MQSCVISITSCLNKTRLRFSVRVAAVTLILTQDKTKKRRQKKKNNAHTKIQQVILRGKGSILQYVAATIKHKHFNGMETGMVASCVHSSSMMKKSYRMNCGRSNYDNQVIKKQYNDISKCSQNALGCT